MIKLYHEEVLAKNIFKGFMYSMINGISFKADYINSQKIKLFKKPNEVIKTAFVELQPDSLDDRNAIYNRNVNWDNRLTLASSIYDKFEDERYVETGRKFFALTLQENNFKKLIPEKIMGLVEVIAGTGGDTIKIKNLQTDPEQKIDAPQRKFKGIGTAILNSIKEHYPKSNTILESANVEYVINFYKANGFKMKKCFDCIIMEFLR